MAEFCLRVVDLETVGFLDEQPAEIQADPCLGIVEIGWTDVLVNVGDDRKIKGIEVDGAFGALLYRPPGGVPPEASAVHHLTDKHLEGQPACSAGAVGLLIKSPPWRGPETPFALVAHNNAFEREWLDKYLPADAKWICTLKVASQLFPEWKSHANQVCRYQLGLAELPEALCMPPHRAGPDSFVTAHVLAAMIPKASVSQMVAWTKMPRMMTRCPIGEHWRGKLWSELDAGSLQWIIDKGAGGDDAVYWARHELQRRRDLAANPDLASAEY